MLKVEPGRESPSPTFADLSPLFRAKTQLPQLPDPLLDRPRLLAALRQAARRRIVVVRSAPGSGKTTALAQLAEADPDTFVWYAVDDLDADALRFLDGLTLVLSGRFDGQPAADRWSGLARVVASLEARAVGIRLIVDDVHRLADPNAARVLADLIRYLPRGASLILSGRGIPPGLDPALAWCAARRQLSTFTWDDLRLSETERAEAARLFRTDGRGGWILAWSIAPPDDAAGWLRREVLDPLGAATIDALARLSVLPSFTLAVAAAVADLSDAAARALLDPLARETPLLDRTDEGIYRLGELARDVLRADLDPAERIRALNRAGGALRAADPLRSAECFVEAGDAPEAAAALSNLPPRDWLTQTPGPAHDVLARLPDAALTARPWLTLARAWSLGFWQGRGEEALRALARADLRSDDDPVRAFWRAYIAARVNLAIGDVPAARAHRCDLRGACETLRRRSDADPRMVARCLNSLAIVERILGDGPQAVSTAEQGLALVELSAAPAREERVLLHHVLGNIHYQDGDYDRAAAQLDLALREARQPDQVTERSALTHILAGIARCRGEYTRALGLLEPALAEPVLPEREKSLLTLQLAHTLLDLGDFRGAGRRYREIASRYREPDRDWCFSRARAGLAICYSLLGLVAEAEATILQLRALASGVPGYDLALAEGVAALQRLEFDRAAERFGAARTAVGTLAGVRDTWQAVLLQAQARWRRGEESEAEYAIASFLSELAGGAIPALPGWVVEPVEPLLARLGARLGSLDLVSKKAPRADSESPRLRHALAAVDLTASTATRQVEVRLFGPPRLLLDGDEAPWPRGLRRKSVELFWYAALHPEGFQRDAAQADLFPDDDARRGAGQLAVAISELRRVLGSFGGIAGNRVLARGSGPTFQLYLDALGSVRSDLRELEDLAARLRPPRREPAPPSIPELFRGELVAGLSAEWVEPIRRYWSTVYLRTLLTLAARYARAGELQPAIRCHELALAVDPTRGASHAQLLRLFHAAGDPQAVEAQMWLYRRVARDELGLPPSPEIQKLYQQLTAVNPL